MLHRLLAQSVGIEREYDITFTPRLNIFTGDNGLGKTFVLDLAWWALTQSWKRRPQKNAWANETTPNIQAWLGGPGATDLRHLKAVYDPTALSWSTNAMSTRSADVCICANSDGSFTVWDSLRKQIIDRQIAQQSFYSPGGVSVPSASYHFTQKAVLNGLTDQSSGKIQCRGLISDLVDWQIRPTDLQHSPFLYMTEVLRTISPHREPISIGGTSRLSPDDVRVIPNLKFPYGEVPIHFCSAAVLRLVSLAYILVWSWVEHLELSKLTGSKSGAEIVILIDEVEMHLHPKWQRSILRSLLTASQCLKKEANTQLIATTHSPLVLASCEPFVDDDLDSLFLFTEGSDTVQLLKQPWVKEGDASSWLVSEIFDLAQARSIEAEAAIAKAEQYMLGDRSVDSKTIESELSTLLSTKDPFWARWYLQRRLDDSIPTS